MKLIPFVCFLFSCISISESYRYQYYNKTPPNTTETITNIEDKPTASDVPLDHTKLNSFVNRWLGVPYKYGGRSMNGIDCSAFSQTFYQHFFNIPLKRTAAEQFKQGVDVSSGDYDYGDLIFFRIEGSDIDHVGVYLYRDRFIHASSSQGVTISSLTEDYYSSRYAGAKRLTD